MTTLLRIGWLMLVVVAFIDGLVFASRGDQWRALVMGIVVALLLILRTDITDEPGKG